MSNGQVSQPCEEWAEMLALFQVDDLPTAQRKALGAHLLTCPQCAAILADYQFIHNYMQRALSVEPLADLPPSVFKQKRTWKQTLDAISSLLVLLARRSIPAIVVLVGLLTFLLARQMMRLTTIDSQTAVAIALAPAMISSIILLMVLNWSDLRSRLLIRHYTYPTSSLADEVFSGRRNLPPDLQGEWQDAEEMSLVVSSRSLALKRQRNKQGWRERNISLWIIFLLLVNIAAAGSLLFLPPPGPIRVTNLQDSGPGSLRQALNVAPSGGTIMFAPDLRGEIHLTSGDLNVNRNITLQGTDPSYLSISSGRRGYKVRIGRGISASFIALTFTGSTIKNAAFIDNEGNLALTNCAVTKNTTYYDGGGIANWYGNVTLINSKVSENTSNGNGGGIYNLQGTLTVINSIVTGNTSSGGDGGGIYDLRGTVTITGSTILANATSSHDTNGGGIVILNGLLNLTRSTIHMNHTQRDGGGLAILGSQAILTSSSLANNTAKGRGGDLAVENDPDNNYSSQALLINMPISSDNHASAYTDILGSLTINDPHRAFVISKEPDRTGKPSSSAEQSPQFLGIADTNAFCQARGYTSGASLDVPTAYDAKCQLATGEPTQFQFSRAEVCQWQFHQPDAIDRLADYYDPSSWQCYAHEKLFASIATSIKPLEQYCLTNYRGDIILNGPTAYDWKCRTPSSGLMGLNMLEVCRHFNPDAIDRLGDFNNPYSWQCWTPRSAGR